MRTNFGSTNYNSQIPYEISHKVNDYICEGDYRKATCLLKSYKKYLKSKENSNDLSTLNESKPKRHLVSDIANILNVRNDIPKIIHFIDTHSIDTEKLYQYVKDASISDRLNILTAMLGKDDNPLQLDFIKRYKRTTVKESHKMNATNGELLDLAIKRIMLTVSKKMDDMKSKGQSDSDEYRSLESKYNSLLKKINSNG